MYKCNPFTVYFPPVFLSQTQGGRLERGEHPGVPAAARPHPGVRAQRPSQTPAAGAQRAAGHHEQGTVGSNELAF